jgi:MinD-like ATPase involved in chromosome partitioning or flagellar assembly
MFNALLFVQQDENSQAIEKLARESGQVSIQRVLSSLRPDFELTLMLNTHYPDLIFLDLSDWDYASWLAVAIRARHPEIPIVGFGGGWAEEIGPRSAQLGIGDVLIAPVTVKEFDESVFRAIHGPQVAVQDNLIAFLPAKAGSGCSTVTLNSAGCLAGALGKKTLLIEADLKSGVLSVLMNSPFRCSVLDALERADQLDYSTWTNCVVKKYGIDMLLADRSKPIPIWSNYHHLLQFTQSRFDLILADLPEVVNEASAEIVRRAKYNFIVCTPEKPSLTLAQRRCKELEGWGISPARVGIIVNRWHDCDIGEAEIEDRLQHGVAAIFPNDYPSVHKATEEGLLVDQSTELGKTFLSFAKRVADIPEPDSHAFKSKFAFLKTLRALPMPPIPLLRAKRG